MISTSWSRWLRDSRNFSATITTSSALPASTPFSVRYWSSTATEGADSEQRVARCAAASASGTGRCRTASAIAVSSSTGIQAASVGQCGKLVPTTMAAVQSRRLRLERELGARRDRASATAHACSTAASMPASNNASASRHAARCFGPSPERDVRARQAQREAAARGVGVEAPARELRRAAARRRARAAGPNRAGTARPSPLENSFRSSMIVARVRFPRDALRRVAGRRRAQAREIVVAGLRPPARCRRPRRRGSGRPGSAGRG